MTAKEFLNGDEDNAPWSGTLEGAMIEFAQFHVKAALEAAANEADLDVDFYISIQEGFIGSIDKNSILQAYPLTNIK